MAEISAAPTASRQQLRRAEERETSFMLYSHFSGGYYHRARASLQPQACRLSATATSNMMMIYRRGRAMPVFSLSPHPIIEEEDDGAGRTRRQHQRNRVYHAYFREFRPSTYI